MNVSSLFLLYHFEPFGNAQGRLHEKSRSLTFVRADNLAGCSKTLSESFDGAGRTERFVSFDDFSVHAEVLEAFGTFLSNLLDLADCVRFSEESERGCC
jgi:hypothetical protein